MAIRNHTKQIGRAMEMDSVKAGINTLKKQNPYCVGLWIMSLQYRVGIPYDVIKGSTGKV